MDVLKLHSVKRKINDCLNWQNVLCTILFVTKVYGCPQITLKITIYVLKLLLKFQITQIIILKL